jgi:hypothetical protein
MMSNRKVQLEVRGKVYFVGSLPSDLTFLIHTPRTSAGFTVFVRIHYKYSTGVYKGCALLSN